MTKNDGKHPRLYLATTNGRDETQALETLKEEIKSPDYAESAVKITPGLNMLGNFLFVAGLALRRPHEYNVNVMVWDNVKQEKLLSHGR